MATRGIALAAMAGEVVRLASAAAVTPTQQVINMLSEMRQKGEKNLNAEEKTYFFYKEWVEDETRQLGFDIQDGGRKIEELIAFIEQANSNAAAHGEAIAALEAEIEKHSGEKADATKIRETQHAEYLTLSQDYSESVDALKRAVAILSSQNYDRGQAEMLLQKMSTTIPGMPRVLAAFMQETKGRSSLRGDGAPAVAAYEFQSGGIVELLEGLHKKFKQELADTEEDETNRNHENNLVQLHLGNMIEKDGSDRDEKAIAKKKEEAASARAQGELSETKAAKAADEKTKLDMETTFEAKTATYGENQKVREGELQALDKAIEIISSPAVSASYAKRVNAELAQTGRIMSFLQVGRAASFSKARALLEERAKALGSKELASVAASVDPNAFGKVITMIEDLVAKLKEQASAEAEHKAWCDEQLKQNKLKRNKKTAQVNSLVAEIQGMEAEIADLGATIAKLAKEQVELTEAMQKATQIRDAEKAENLAIIADSKAGFSAVGQALVVLKEFYASQASFLQQVPEMAAYNGQQSSNKGVVGMLEVIQTDFARLRAQTETAEEAAATEYAAFMQDSTVSKKQKHDEEFKLKLDKDQVEYERGETKKDLVATEAELAMANKYYEYLKPTCTEVHVNWEDRVAHREEEVAALKEAYGILDQKGPTL